jgi:hypothetical protein
VSVTLRSVVAFPLVTVSDVTRLRPSLLEPYTLLTSEQGFAISAVMAVDASCPPAANGGGATIPFVPYERSRGRHRKFLPSVRNLEGVAHPPPADVKATPFAAFFPNDDALVPAEIALAPGFCKTTEFELVEGALSMRSRARFEVQDIVLQHFFPGISFLFSEAQQWGGFNGLALSRNADGEYVMRSEHPVRDERAPDDAAKVKRRTVLSFNGRTRSAPEAALADLLALAAQGRLIALESGTLDATSEEVLRGAAHNDMELYPLTVQMPERPSGAFVPSEFLAPTLAILMGSPEEVLDAWEASVEQFIAAGIDASRAWRAHARRAKKMQ